MIRESLLEIAWLAVTQTWAVGAVQPLDIKPRKMWLEQRREELLPTEYFHVVFTLPEPLAAIAFYNKKSSTISCSAPPLRPCSPLRAPPQRLGVELGFMRGAA